MSSVVKGTFSKCDNIADFYGYYNIPVRKTIGAFGGKSFTWFVTDRGQSFQIDCACNVLTLGLGSLSIQSRMGGLGDSRLFSECIVENSDERNGKFKMKGALGFTEHEVRIPVPDKI